MTFSAFISFLFAQVVKPLVAMLLSLCMTIGAMLTGPMGNYQLLMLKSMGTDPVHEHLDYEVLANPAFIASLAGEDITSDGTLAALKEAGVVDEKGMVSVKGDVDTYFDLGKAKLAIEFGNDKGADYGIYLAPTALAVSPDLTRDVLSNASLFGKGRADAYAKHLSGYGFYLGFDELEGLEPIPAEYVNTVTEGTSLVKQLIENVFNAMSTEESLASFRKICELSESLTKDFYSETTVDGVKAYTCSYNGKQYLELFAKELELMSSEEYINAYVAVMDATMKALDMEKLLTETGKLSGLSDEEIKAVIEQYKAEMQSLDYKTIFAEDFKNINEDFAPYLNALITGEGTNELFGEYGQTVAALLPIVHGSNLTSTVYEKDGKIFESFEFNLGTAELPIVSVKYSSTTEKYDGEIKSPESVVPFGVRLTEEVLENKVGFESAKGKGVSSIEIEWDSEMQPNYAEAEIGASLFYVNYKTTQWQAIDADESLTPEEKEAHKNYYAEDEYEYNTLDTSAKLIDNSVYLPLRRLMENAGYEVSWDAEARKAYVTVDGNKIEMTGTIVDNKTYVKVRDFEKLGAKVDYEETIYYADAWNDFSKSCYATITFK